jgi:hypothetical protein
MELQYGLQKVLNPGHFFRKKNGYTPPGQPQRTVEERHQFVSAKAADLSFIC